MCPLPKVCTMMKFLWGLTLTLNLSLKYHRLHPEYIHQRIERLGHSYSLRILLMLCDVVRTVCIHHIPFLTNLRVSIKTLSANLQRCVQRSVIYEQN